MCFNLVCFNTRCWLGVCNIGGNKREVYCYSYFRACTGAFLAVLCVAAGVGALVSHYPILLTSLTIVGACYLLWMGISLLIRPATISSTEQQTSTFDSAKSWFVKGVGISGLNPKVLLLFCIIAAIYSPKLAVFSYSSDPFFRYYSFN